MPDPISHAEMIAWMRAHRKWVEPQDTEMAEAVLLHLERTQPRPQADLTERVSAMYLRAYLRASDIWKHQQRDWEGIFVKCQREEMAAALQSEREAAAAEARRVRYARYEGPMDAAECARIMQTPFYQHGDAILVWVNEGDILLSGTLASPPAPQEETR